MEPKFRFDKTAEILFELKVGDVMTSDLVTAHPDTSMNALKDILRENKISGLPVVKNEKLAGMISVEDLILWLSECGKDATIESRMTQNTECIYQDQPLVHAIRKFEQFHYGRFPVLDRESNKLVGIITKGDIIRGTLQKLESEFKEEELRQYRASHIFSDIIADHKQIYLEYSVKGQDFDSAGKASTTVKKNLRRLGIRPDYVQRLAIASYEAEMNIVIYTEGGTMHFFIHPEKIIFEARDNGPGIEDIDMAMKDGFTTSPEWVKEMGFGAGMGLSNMKKCADTMVLESTVGVGTKVNVTIMTGNANETL